MRADYGQRYRDLYDRHWWWRAREEFVLDVLRANQPAWGWRRILDVGCGDRLFFDQLSQFGEVEGVEPAEDLVTKAGAHCARIHIGRFDKSFQPSKGFSLILMLDVLEHLEDPVSAVRHALSLLSPAGVLVITVPAFNLLWTNHDTINEHFIRYTKTSFRTLAQQAGMTIEAERYFFHWLFFVKLATRCAERLLRLGPKPPKIPIRPVNDSLYWLCRLESNLLRSVPVPIGSSLLVVGRRPTAAGQQPGREGPETRG